MDEDRNGPGVGDDGDDDLDDARDDGDKDADDLPLREEFSLVESAHRRGLFFYVGLRLAATAKLLI